MNGELFTDIKIHLAASDVLIINAVLINRRRRGPGRFLLDAVNVFPKPKTMLINGFDGNILSEINNGVPSSQAASRHIGQMLMNKSSFSKV